MKAILLSLITIAALMSGCATYEDYDWEGTADNWHDNVEMGRR